MKIISADRGQGKTTELIKRSNKEWKYIICADIKRVEIISTMARGLGLDIPYPIAVRELPLSNGSFIKSVLIDDIEDVLQSIIGKKVDCVTTSCEIVSIEGDFTDETNR
ncbi:MAG TPA: replicase [Epulopiscium sp.]|nr:replicase [Candidatus Epulonipiscium sp.]